MAPITAARLYCGGRRAPSRVGTISQIKSPNANPNANDTNLFSVWRWDPACGSLRFGVWGWDVELGVWSRRPTRGVPATAHMKDRERRRLNDVGGEQPASAIASYVLRPIASPAVEIDKDVSGRVSQDPARFKIHREVVCRSR